MGKFLIGRLQIDGVLPEDREYLNNITIPMDRNAFICCLQLVRNDGDIAGLISGAVNTGKSTWAITLAQRIKFYLKEYFRLDVKPFSLENDVVYGKSKTSFDELLGDTQFNVKVIDEGYLSGLNLDSTKDVTVYIGKVMNITRSKNNVLLWCFQKMDRAAKFLSERFNLWYHKPRKQYVLLFARSNIFTPADPWGVKKLLEAKSERAIKHYLKHNLNKVTYFKVPKLPAAEFNRYKKLKALAHLEMKMQEETKARSREVTMSVLDELYVKINKGDLNVIDIPQYLSDKYSLTEAEVRTYIKKYGDYSTMKKVLKVKSEEVLQ